ncbi:hypothetical protein KXS07_04900 [Inquilinus limosus]|uniref:hypothetical protein n=1 Tax=Inquilinus limosus TaxID=171674 RepID=UPI00047CFD15|nr:hypothetical protein [Inquilinus limosus]
MSKPIWIGVVVLSAVLGIAAFAITGSPPVLWLVACPPLWWLSGELYRACADGPGTGNSEDRSRPLRSVPRWLWFALLVVLPITLWYLVHTEIRPGVRLHWTAVAS